MEKITSIMNEAAIAAAQVILDVYRRPIVAGEKSDGSPVTEADHRAEAVILEHLRQTGLPVLAEESVAAGHVPVLGEEYFVVDPLDGTKEFIKRNGEFTVNIALCRNHRPVLGVVLAPARAELFWGGPEGAWRASTAGGRIGPASRLEVQTDGPLLMVASRSHGHEALARFCQTMNVAGMVSVGSSLKFCLIADRQAQLYPRFTPTSEWDTAAGQAVLEAAGGVVLGLDGRPLTCGHADAGFINPGFVAASSHDLATRAMREMVRLVS